jgi:hypothetical protein
VASDVLPDDPVQVAALAAVRAALAARPGWRLPEAPVLFSRWSRSYFAIAFDSRAAYRWELARGDTPAEALAALASRLAKH